MESNGVHFILNPSDEADIRQDVFLVMMNRYVNYKNFRRYILKVWPDSVRAGHTFKMYLSKFLSRNRTFKIFNPS